jgi:AcrR family transcriptional regulator
MEHATASPSRVATRIAAQTAAVRHRPDYVGEVAALLDAARRVISATGTTAKARVADIVAEAGLSNDAFYRHFPSKDALVAALVEDGAERVAAAVGRGMAEEPSAEGRVRRWLESMLGLVDESKATSTLAVLWNSSNLNASIPTGDHAALAPLAALLHEPFRALGSARPELDAELVAHAVLGRVGRHLWARTHPTGDEADHLRRFCLSTARLSGSSATPCDLPKGAPQP